jgi:hypothetical protein
VRSRDRVTRHKSQRTWKRRPSGAETVRNTPLQKLARERLILIIPVSIASGLFHAVSERRRSKSSRVCEPLSMNRARSDSTPERFSFACGRRRDTTDDGVRWHRPAETVTTASPRNCSTLRGMRICKQKFI